LVERALNHEEWRRIDGLDRGCVICSFVPSRRDRDSGADLVGVERRFRGKVVLGWAWVGSEAATIRNGIEGRLTQEGLGQARYGRATTAVSEQDRALADPIVVGRDPAV